MDWYLYAMFLVLLSTESAFHLINFNFMIVRLHRFLLNIKPIMGIATILNSCWVHNKMFARQLLANDKTFRERWLIFFCFSKLLWDICCLSHLFKSIEHGIFLQTCTCAAERNWCIYFTCNRFFESIFSAHRGMKRFILVVWLRGMASVQLDWIEDQPSLPFSTPEGKLYESFCHRLSSSVNMVHVHNTQSINWPLSCVFWLMNFYCVTFCEVKW